ncbi:MAG: N-acetylmuramoyl-L-alanine amidase [Rhizobiales bacterium]|nr:N-acetylmuramoyl-L-alanine amidase [Hyphomicrobiales bacterium]OJU33152.1 MAG: N-acetylmuramoyl-L-alanine amidase [Rhizobiales bacterium 68-8]
MSGFVSEHAGAEVRVSPNFGPRRDGMRPDMIVLHYTGMQRGEAAEMWLCNPESEVSSHYIVHEDGRIVQMVREADRAWHAGRSSWRGVTDINSCSIGIEICNPGHEFGYPDFCAPQIEAVIALCAGISMRHGVAPERVLAHSDVAPGRKRDPGEKFPWAALHAAGIGHLVPPAPVRGGRFLTAGESGEPVEALQSMLALYGYGLEITGFFDAATQAVVEAFQRHFRPALVDGVADRSTIETLHLLLSALPGRLS